VHVYIVNRIQPLAGAGREDDHTRDVIPQVLPEVRCFRRERRGIATSEVMVRLAQSQEDVPLEDQREDITPWAYGWLPLCPRGTRVIIIGSRAWPTPPGPNASI
jgi:hypothetical protein